MVSHTFRNGRRSERYPKIVPIIFFVLFGRAIVFNVVDSKILPQSTKKINGKWKKNVSTFLPLIVDDQENNAHYAYRFIENCFFFFYFFMVSGRVMTILWHCICHDNVQNIFKRHLIWNKRRSKTICASNWIQEQKRKRKSTRDKNRMNRRKKGDENIDFIQNNFFSFFFSSAFSLLLLGLFESGRIFFGWIDVCKSSRVFDIAWPLKWLQYEIRAATSTFLWFISIVFASVFLINCVDQWSRCIRWMHFVFFRFMKSQWKRRMRFETSSRWWPRILERHQKYARTYTAIEISRCDAICKTNVENWKSMHRLEWIFLPFLFGSPSSDSLTSICSMPCETAY